MNTEREKAIKQEWGESIGSAIIKNEAQVDADRNWAPSDKNVNMSVKENYRKDSPEYREQMDRLNQEQARNDPKSGGGGVSAFEKLSVMAKGGGKSLTQDKGLGD